MGDTTGTAADSAELSRSAVLARAATLSPDECGRLYDAYRRLASGTYATRFRRALVDGYTVYQGPILEVRGSVDRTLDRTYRDQLRHLATAALARAAGGSAAAPGDPGAARTLVRRIVLLGSWAATAILLVALAVLPSAESSALAPAFGLSVLVAGAATGWVSLVPNRAGTLVLAIEDAALAELRRGALSTSTVDLLGQPWREAVLGTAPGQPPGPPLDRLAGAVGAIALLALLVGFAGMVGGGSGSAIGGAGLILVLVGIGLCSLVIAIVGASWVRSLVGLARDPGRGVGGTTTAARFLFAAILGGLAFGVGDAAKDATGWVALVVAVGAAFVLGWRWRAVSSVAGYLLGGYVGTWLSVQVQLQTQPVDLGTELGASTIVAIVAGGAGLVGLGLGAIAAPADGISTARGTRGPRLQDHAVAARSSRPRPPADTDLHGDVALALDRLGELGGDGWATLVSDPDRNYYVQLATRGGTAHAEAVGSAYLRTEDALDQDQEAGLERLGWRRSPNSADNWGRDFSGWPGCRADVEAALRETLTSVYGWRPGTPLAIRMGS